MGVGRIVVLSTFAALACEHHRVGPTTTPASVAAAPEQAPRIGFTLYGPDRTIVITARPQGDALTDVAVTVVPLLLAVDAAGTVHARETFDPAALDDEDGRAWLWAHRCPLGERGSDVPGDSVLSTAFAPGRDPAGTLEPGCVAVPYAERDVFLARGLTDDDATWVDVPEPETDEEEYEDEFGPCDGGSPEALVGFFAGTLQYLAIDDNNACSGVHVIDADVGIEPWIDAAPSVERELPARRPEVVVVGGAGEVDWSYPPSPPPAEAADDDDEDEDDELETCTPMDGEIESLHRGLRVRSIVGTDAVVSCAWHYVEPARACPTAADPCGDPAAFAPLARADHDFWIANDGRVGLQWGPHAQLWWRAATGVRAIDLDLDELPREPFPVIGVRFVDDAGFLDEVVRTIVDDDGQPWILARSVPAIAEPAPPGRPEAAGVHDKGDGRAWANHCFAEFKARRLDAAAQACAYARTLARTEATRAAIQYSLGRIAAAQGQHGAAAIHFRTALALRPSDAAAEALGEALRQAW